jgi:hypothetical protein
VFHIFNPAGIALTAFVILPTLLQWGYYGDPGAYNVAYCRLRFYFYYVFGALSPYYLILASIDRILITSRAIRVRQWSTCRVAYISITGMTIFWMIFHIHTLIYIGIYLIIPDYYSCTYTPGIYTIFVNYYQLIVRGIFATLLMSIFGLLTVKNIRSTHRVIPAHETPVVKISARNGLRHFTQKDRQFILMLFIDIIIYILCSIPRPVYLFYIQITQYQTKTDERQSIEAFMNSLSLFITFIPTGVDFHMNFLISKTFRQYIFQFWNSLIMFEEYWRIVSNVLK